MAKLVVGLGNIGKEFENTNHNMGFIVLDSLTDEFNLKFNKNMCSSMVAETNINGEKVYFAKPTTYMNLSGIAVKSLCEKFDIDISHDLLIISDDIDLQPGKIRIREVGSAGTHNGLKNIIEQLKTTAFPRVRVGIGTKNENQDLADFVLQKAHFDDELKMGLEKAKNAVKLFVEGSKIPDIMQKYN